MKVTKYPQSCLVIEEGENSLVIDPGSLALAAHTFREMAPKAGAVLYTHQHSDHYESSVVDELIREGVQLYGNKDVAGLIGDKATVVEAGRAFTAGGFSVMPYDLPHFLMSDGSAGPPNTGYLINDVLFHPGDGVELAGLKVTAAAIPIAGPSTGLDEAIRFAQELQAQTVIPIHYDVFENDPQEFALRLKSSARVVVLGDGESISL